MAPLVCMPHNAPGRSLRVWISQMAYISEKLLMEFKNKAKAVANIISNVIRFIVWNGVTDHVRNLNWYCEHDLAHRGEVWILCLRYGNYSAWIVNPGIMQNTNGGTISKTFYAARLWVLLNYVFSIRFEDKASDFAPFRCLSTCISVCICSHVLQRLCKHHSTRSSTGTSDFLSS